MDWTRLQEDLMLLVHFYNMLYNVNNKRILLIVFIPQEVQWMNAASTYDIRCGEDLCLTAAAGINT